MKKLFISQPMNGKTEEEILAVRKKAIESAEVVLNEDVEVIESYFEDYNRIKLGSAGGSSDSGMNTPFAISSCRISSFFASSSAFFFAFVRS